MTKKAAAPKAEAPGDRLARVRAKVAEVRSQITAASQRAAAGQVEIDHLAAKAAELRSSVQALDGEIEVKRAAFVEAQATVLIEAGGAQASAAFTALQTAQSALDETAARREAAQAALDAAIHEAADRMDEIKATVAQDEQQARDAQQLLGALQKAEAVAKAAAGADAIVAAQAERAALEARRKEAREALGAVDAEADAFYGERLSALASEYPELAGVSAMRVLADTTPRQMEELAAAGLAYVSALEKWAGHPGALRIWRKVGATTFNLPQLLSMEYVKDIIIHGALMHSSTAAAAAGPAAVLGRVRARLELVLQMAAEERERLASEPAQPEFSRVMRLN
jgi:hypothetical protein